MVSSPTFLLLYDKLNSALGYTQSGPLFHAKTRALEKHLQKHFPSTILIYPTAPHVLNVADIPGYTPITSGSHADGPSEAFGWWRRKGDDPIIYEGLEKGLDVIADTIRKEGPFDGVMGFSQGGAAAAMVASLLEDGEGRMRGYEAARQRGGVGWPMSFLEDGEHGKMIQPAMKFAVVYSGFRAPGILYKGLYEPKMKTKTLHFLGQLDSVVDEGRSRALIDVCEHQEVVVHPGGHFLPSQRPWLDAVVAFLKGVMEGSAQKEGVKEEEKAEDMDMPF